VVHLAGGAALSGATRLLAAHIQQSKLEVRHITLDMIHRARRSR